MADILVTSVSVDPTSKEIAVGESFTITPTVLPSNATNKLLNWNVHPADGNPLEFTVNSSGVVTGHAPGTGTVECVNTSSGKNAYCAVTVTAATATTVPVTGVSVSTSNMTLTVG